MINKFNNAQELHKQYPDSFHIPTNVEINNIKKGSLVKVCALSGGNCNSDLYPNSAVNTSNLSYSFVDNLFCNKFYIFLHI